MEMFSFFIGAGAVSVGYLVCSLIGDVVKDYQYKKYKAAQDIDTKFAIENASIEGMKTEIKNLRSAYTHVSSQLASIEKHLSEKNKKKK